jgi:iron complex transport system ATP-binding protein
MLEIVSLTVNYGIHPALHEVSLSVRRGETLALIGPNGAGKTTLIRAASGVLKMQAGTVWVAGQDIRRMSPAERARRIAVVPQARNLPDDFTVWQTAMLGRTPHLDWLGHPGPRDGEQVRWALERTGALELAERLIGQLSGGEQQRVLLARALAQDTPILLLDEPTTHLDLRHQSGLLSLVRKLARERGLAVLMALHDLNLAALYADRVALLVSGRIQAAGSPQEVLTAPRLADAYGVPVEVILHPEYGTPLVLPDGKNQEAVDRNQETGG